MRWTLLWAFLVACPPVCRPLPAAERWEIQYFYDKNDSSLTFLDLQFPSAQHGVALGFIVERQRRKPAPVMAITSNGGHDWELLPIKERGSSLFFLNEKSGWLIGEQGKLFKSTDGGRRWTRVPLPGIRAQPVRVFFSEESRGWLLCNQKQVFSTGDGGRSWQLLPISRQPDFPEDETVYNWAAFLQNTILLTGWSRAPERPSRLPEWMQPESIPIGRHPTTGIILHTVDGGKTWGFSPLRRLGEIMRLRLSAAGEGLVLLRHPDSLSLASEIIGLEIKAFRGQSVYANKDRYITDIIFLGARRAVATAIDQEGRTPFPAIPARLKVLQATDARHWTEMEVDYRAEARSAFLAAPDAAHAWIATDTGMILKLVNE